MRRSSLPPRRPALRHRQAGYNVVVLAVFFAILSVGLAAATPYWSSVIQREKEAELIFRGMQYAEALRVFQQRFGRQPVRLEELLEVEPRSIRQLWDDPMSESGRWSVMYGAAQPGAEAPGAQGAQAASAPSASVAELLGDSLARALEDEEGSREGEEIGPIRGVQSRADEEAFRRFQGRDQVAAWQFTPEAIPPVTGGEGEARDPYVNADWMLRQLPADLGALLGGGLDDGSGAGGAGDRDEGGEDESDFDDFDPFADEGDEGDEAEDDELDDLDSFFTEGDEDGFGGGDDEGDG